MATHTLRVVKEPFGWTIRLGAGMTSSFRTRAQALVEAECLCDELRRHGEEAEVLIEESREAAEPGDLHAAARLEELLRKIRPPEKGGR